MKSNQGLILLGSILIGGVVIPGIITKLIEVSLSKNLVAELNIFQNPNLSLSNNAIGQDVSLLNENTEIEKELIAARIDAPKNAEKNCISKEEILQNQKDWGDGIVFIGETYQSNGDYKVFATNLVDNLYGYDRGTVLFKPTKAADKEFRLTKAEAISYFVAGDIAEDRGFAIQPWSKVRFENAGIIINCDSALAMGDYYFTDAKTDREIKAEYTFGYQKNSEGKLTINLHHSSFPYHQEN